MVCSRKMEPMSTACLADGGLTEVTNHHVALLLRVKHHKTVIDDAPVVGYPTLLIRDGQHQMLTHTKRMDCRGLVVVVQLVGIAQIADTSAYPAVIIVIPLKASLRVADIQFRGVCLYIDDTIAPYLIQSRTDMNLAISNKWTTRWAEAIGIGHSFWMADDDGLDGDVRSQQSIGHYQLHFARQ